MAKNGAMTLPVLDPNLQVSFYYKLQTVRKLHFHEALGKTIRALPLADMDRELAEYVSSGALSRAASFGLRGEVLFPVPSVIGRNPRLLAYHRLLYGFSQKEFYNKGPFGKFRQLEEKGQIPAAVAPRVGDLCRSLVASGERLVRGIDKLSMECVQHLQLLTLGPQLRGEENTRIGQKATAEAFDLLRRLVAPYIQETTRRTIILKNDSGRAVILEFASDPDIRITAKLTDGARPLVSIEIKGGADASNVHNRLGEAEKSHQKARGLGFFEFWTLLRVDLDRAVAKRESPTTSRFFHLDRIQDASSPEHRRFRDLLASIIGIKARS